MKRHNKARFKFKWNYLGIYKDKKKLSFEEMIEEYIEQAKETQKVLNIRRMRKLKRKRRRIR